MCSMFSFPQCPHGMKIVIDAWGGSHYVLKIIQIDVYFILFYMKILYNIKIVFFSFLFHFTFLNFMKFWIFYSNSNFIVFSRLELKIICLYLFLFEQLGRPIALIRNPICIFCCHGSHQNTSIIEPIGALFVSTINSEVIHWSF